uniref:Ion transport domain-containing protein n=1 Tax=Branchiostoma floridae TaxID=7739 RepID=C3YUX1_BRAFL|eukprot:XP_002600010.1 hypothetical protein BRAFLDRAFT_74127 [Branchiostoma floridae]
MESFSVKVMFSFQLLGQRPHPIATYERDFPRLNQTLVNGPSVTRNYSDALRQGQSSSAPQATGAPAASRPTPLSGPLQSASQGQSSRGSVNATFERFAPAAQESPPPVRPFFRPNQPSEPWRSPPPPFNLPPTPWGFLPPNVQVPGPHSRMNSPPWPWHPAMMWPPMVTNNMWFVAEEVLEANRYVGPVYFTFFMVGIFLILVNFLVAIICDAIASDASIDQDYDQELVDYIWNSFQQIFGIHLPPTSDVKTGEDILTELNANLQMIQESLDDTLDIARSMWPDAEDTIDCSSFNQTDQSVASNPLSKKPSQDTYKLANEAEPRPSTSAMSMVYEQAQSVLRTHEDNAARLDELQNESRRRAQAIVQRKLAAKRRLGHTGRGDKRMEQIAENAEVLLEQHAADEARLERQFENSRRLFRGKLRQKLAARRKQKNEEKKILANHTMPGDQQQSQTGDTGTTPMQKPQTDCRARADAAASIPTPMYASGKPTVSAPNAISGEGTTPMQQPQTDWQSIANAAASIPNALYISRAASPGCDDRPVFRTALHPALIGPSLPT